MERCVARLLQHYGFEGVQLVGGAGEKGADVVAIQNNERWVFQVKYKQSSSVDKKAIEEAFDAYKSYEAKHAVTVTNSTFNSVAENYHNKLVEAGFNIYLWDRNTLTRIGEDFLKDASAAKKTPHSYQQKAINKIIESME